MKEPPLDEQFRLAVATAKRFVQRRPLPPTLEFEDIVGECLLALRWALQRYNPEKYPNVKWTTYATYTMIGFIHKAYEREMKHHFNRVYPEYINTNAVKEALGVSLDEE